MVDIRVICKSYSLWSSTVVLVQKKIGDLCFCIDLQKLNNLMKKDTYPLPCIDDTMDSLAGAKYFSSLDLKSGYGQVEMDEESKKYTAFTVRLLSFYKCDRMPFRLCNVPAMF